MVYRETFIRPDPTKVREHTMNQNEENKIVDPISYHFQQPYRVMDKLRLEVHTVPKSKKGNLNTRLARTIMGLSEAAYELLGIRGDGK